MSTLKSTLFAIGFTAIGAVLGTAGLAVADGGPSGPGGPGGFGAHLYHLYADLDLSEARQTQLEDIRAFVREEANQDRQDRRADGAQVAELLGQSKPDRDTIHKLVDQRIAQKADLAHDTIDKFLDLHATLTDAQRAELVANLEERSERDDDQDDDGSPEKSRRGR